MTRLPGLALAGLGLLLAAEAQACRIRRPAAVPLASNVDAVALTTVIGGDDHGADLRIDEVLDGRLAPAPVHIDFGGRQDLGGGIVVTSCGPAGPAVGPGERVVLVYGRASSGERYLIGWVTLAFAAEADDFFALYRRAGTPGVRWRLRARFRQVNRHRGPVPRTDPEHWLPAHAGGGLGWGEGEGFSYVGLRVADDGRIAECSGLQGMSNSRSEAICAGISDRRFLPPMFERERNGVFRVRWNGP